MRSLINLKTFILPLFQCQFANCILICSLLLSFITPSYGAEIFHQLDSSQSTDHESIYQPKLQVTGRVFSVGSDTLSPLISIWGNAFSQIYPNVHVLQQASGSSSAPIALIEGTASIGPMSRQMNDKEKQSFQAQYGYLPIELKVAIDAIGIFVHQDNPIVGLNMKQLDSIFSSTMRCRGKHAILTWQDLGITQSWGERRIEKFGRNSASGTYGYFKHKVLCDGDYQVDVNELAGGFAVSQGVGSAMHSIGYSGIRSQLLNTRLLPIAREGSHYISPTQENIRTRKYPLTRYLYIYINQPPNKSLNLVEREFLYFILSQQGQRLAEKAGYLPLAPSLANAQLQQIKP